MRYKINISHKEDWLNKCKGKIDLSKFDISYSNLLEQTDFSRFDAVIPLFESHIIHLNNIPGTLNGRKFILPDNDIVNICADKKQFYDFLESNGFIDFTPVVSPTLTVPFIIKKRVDEWGKNSIVIKNKIHEFYYSKLIESDNYIKQEYLFGKDEYTTHFIFEKGEFKYLFTLKFLFKKKCYVKGVKSPPFKKAIITEYKTEFEEIFAEILRALNYEGVGCINFKVYENLPKIFEINPRVGGSLPLDVNRFLHKYIDVLN